MLVITVKNLTLQFDGLGEGSKLDEARDVVELVNKTLYEAGLSCQPQLEVRDFDQDDVEVDYDAEPRFDEED